MKSPLDKLRRFAMNKRDSKDKRYFQPSAQLDELAQAAKDMQDMRDCYDSLLSAAAATANSAYEFSESLQEMGTCLLEKTALHDEESGKVLLMLGKTQFELQKLVDKYRTHIFSTITNPSESLLNELRTVEEMKHQCDEKRDVYEYMVAQQNEKARSKSGKGETFTWQQLRAANDEYDEEATLCVFRLKSLKQGQPRSILTQAARHHAAQLNFFRKGLKSLEAVEPHVRLVTEQQHIEYEFSGLEDDDDGIHNVQSGNGGNGERLDLVPMSRNSMEVDEEGVPSSRASKVENPERIFDENLRDLNIRVGSHSAPIFAEKKFDPAEKVRQLRKSSTRKSYTYVLPTPLDAKGTVPSRNSTSVLPTRSSARTRNMWHSSPLEEKKPEKDNGESGLSGPILKAKSVVKDNSNKASTPLPPPLAEGLPLLHFETTNASDANKMKRQAFSDALTSKPLLTKPVSSTSGPIASTELSEQVSGMFSRLPMPQPSSPRVSPSASPPLVLSPRISELHELPRPPSNVASRPSRSPSLVFRNQESGATNRIPSTASSMASPLPTPPLVVPRSFSIPSSSQRAMALHVAKHFESPQVPSKVDMTSPPLTPISLSNMKSLQTVSEVASQSNPIQVDAGGS